MNERDWTEIPHTRVPPDFNNFLAVLSRSKPKRPTLFEFHINDRVCRKLAGKVSCVHDDLHRYVTRIQAFRNAGYDYALLNIPGFSFNAGLVQQELTRSMNEGAVITDRASFDRYEWPDPDKADYGMLDRLFSELPQGMKLIVYGPCGVLENVIRLVGYENLCFKTIDDERLMLGR